MKKGCNVRIIIVDEAVIDNGALPLSTIEDWKKGAESLDEICSKTKNAVGSFKAATTSITPIASVEIRDSWCNVLPYYYQQSREIIPSRMVFKKKNETCVYNEWMKHFENVWKCKITHVKWDNHEDASSPANTSVTATTSF